MTIFISDPNQAQAVHYILEWIALAVGAAVYRARRQGHGDPSLLSSPRFALLVGCLLGAALGNKGVFLIEQPQRWNDLTSAWAALLQGQSIVGGLLGGWIGIEVAKRISGYTGPRTGDDFVPAILAGLLIGRIGCFVSGLNDGTYGLPTNLPWGLDMGDGVPRHPTALYEWLLALIAAVSWPQWGSRLSTKQGLAFRMFMVVYLSWRLYAETLKPTVFAYPGGLSGIQWVCLMAIILILLGFWQDRHRRPESGLS